MNAERNRIRFCAVRFANVGAGNHDTAINNSHVTGGILNDGRGRNVLRGHSEVFLKTRNRLLIFVTEQILNGFTCIEHVVNSKIYYDIAHERTG